MSTTIHAQDGAEISRGRNLRVMFDWARRERGVKRIDVIGTTEGRALVFAFYTPGTYARCEFSCFKHACDWASARSALSPMQSWFGGCEVVVINPTSK